MIEYLKNVFGYLWFNVSSLNKRQPLRQPPSIESNVSPQHIITKQPTKEQLKIIQKFSWTK